MPQGKCHAIIEYNSTSMTSVPKKKILFAITKGNWGGAQRYVFDLATHMPTDQFEVSVVCGEGEQLPEKLQEKHIRVIRLSSLKRNMNISDDLSSFFALYKIFQKEKPDIIHLNSSKIGGIGGLAGRLTGISKIIFTGHGWAWNEDRDPISKALITLGHWATVLLSHKTIAVSEKIKNEINRLPFIGTTKVIVIHNGVDDIEYVERFASRAELNGNISEKFWIGTIAELHKNKGLDTLIRAFADISKSHVDTALVIIGEGEERQNLKQLIRKLQLDKKVHLLGFKENASQFLKAFDVFVLPSRTEALPYVPLEAGLAQLPVIASNVGGIPEIISTGKNGVLVEANHVSEFSTSISTLLDDSTKAATFGHNLRKTVEEKFSISSMVEKTIAVYN